MLELTQVDMQEKIISQIASVSSELLWGIMALILFVFLIVSSVFQYHWGHYGVGENSRTVARTIYWGFSILLIIIMTVSLVIFDS